MKISYGISTLLAAQAAALAINLGGQNVVVKKDSDGLQNIVTYDEHSLLVHGERIFVFSGEFHAYRLPVPDLWLDVFQKVKALGFSAVSFYVHWALLEGEEGVYKAEGIFALEPFLEAAAEAGIYLIARPGPYINAESNGGGFPGWLQRVKGQLRTAAPDYLAATENYVSKVGATIAKYQITNGGPVILVQPENEYSGAQNTAFPDPAYFKYVEDQYRKAGIVVPLINNEAWESGLFAPGSVWNGTTDADLDIFGYDGYPQGFDCSNPYTWKAGALPTYFWNSHLQQSPSTFNSIDEFQAGSIAFWGGSSYDNCAILANHEFERVFYKNNFAQATTLLSLYMIFGGTNWGNLGYPGVYTSYDYGSPITENRELTREKYSELKLEGNFMKVTPAYLTATPGQLTDSTYASTTAITVTPLFGNGSATNLYVVRHSDYQEETPVTYSMTLATSKGTYTIPQLGGNLTLSGRDSKWAVTDYDIGGSTILYSTAEIFTWQKYADKTVAVVYGGPGELHELALISSSPAKTLEGPGITTKSVNGTTVLNWQTSTTRRVVQIGKTFVYIVDRNSAYNYWVPTFSRSDSWGSYSANVGNTTAVIIEAGYLVRKVYAEGKALHIDGDLNSTVPIRVQGAPASAKDLYFNGQKLSFATDSVTGEWSSTLKYSAPAVSLPDLSSLQWKYVDDLPEISPSYDDSAWTVAGHTTTNNPWGLYTPTSLYASDYGYNAATLVYRGHFTATGSESTIALSVGGGNGFGSSAWIGGTFLGSWVGSGNAEYYNSSYTLPKLSAGKKYIFTVLVENNGLDEDWAVGGDNMKYPRGITNYTLSTRPQSAVTWKLTGNLGGEKYIDKVRGPLNEGGLYAERQGFHQPNPPNEHWPAGSPLKGITTAGVAFYQTSFKLNIPKGYDVPLTFNFGNTTINGATSNYQAILYVNGYQFGKYVNNVGPQTSFPVPQGILDYYGTNWITLELWARDANGAHLSNFYLSHTTPILTAMSAPALAPMPAYSKRPGAY